MPADAAASTPTPFSATTSSLADLGGRYREIRGWTETLASPLATEDYVVQSMPDASPVKWHLAHTTWFFETFVLKQADARYKPFHARFDYLFNSYYNSVGERHPRPERGMLTRPTVDEVYEYRAHVDVGMLDLLDQEQSAELLAIVEIGLQHEQQHQELILTDLKHLFSRNPLHPVYRRGGGEATPSGSYDPERKSDNFRSGWIKQAAGLYPIGHEGAGFSYDNETPSHQVYLQAFELAPQPVTNGEFLAFIEDGGYRRPELWLSDGWAAVTTQGWKAPLYWDRHKDGWWSLTLRGLQPVALDEPVCHASYYEADAYARWAGARLPLETEWEVCARSAPIEGIFLESERFHPAALPPAREGELEHVFGNVWEWTASSYGPYPGYRPLEGALGEYNGKFMCNQMVLRGGSCVTPQSHIRATYRNFFVPEARWQFSGIRLARDARGG